MNPRALVRRFFYSIVTKLLGDEDAHVTLPVLSGPAKGIVMRLDMLVRGEGIYWLGKYERCILQTMQAKLLKPGMTAWDCGIYIGLYTCFMARAVGPQGKVVAFEPDSGCLNRSKGNAALNELNNICFVEAAVGDKTGIAKLVLSGNTNSHLEAGWIGSTEEEYRSRVEKKVGETDVQVYTLDDALNAPGVTHPDLVKLDIEGMEGTLIWHAAKLIEKCQPIFIVELHNPECDRQVWRFFAGQPYDVFNADTLEPIASEEQSGGTLLCLPRRKTLQA